MQGAVQYRPSILAADFAAAVKPYHDNPELYKRTNCYSYALGLPELGCAVPGHLTDPSGRLYSHMAHADYMRKLFEKDGLIEISHDTLCIAKTQVIAVAIKEYFNGHVLKYHQDGTWSHQAGFAQPITNLDSDNKIIIDPRQANLGFYDEFVAYFKVPEAGLAIASF
jgi:hypothetical protein|tara:strand:+ start:105385 stop:105885 length:501 start_codon:yes stop_codon:yes gene_type:complete